MTRSINQLPFLPTFGVLPGEELGINGFAPPFLAPTTDGPVVLQGVNYASGGGGILNHTGKIFVMFPFHLLIF